jgi:flagellar biosynthesis anti-sigma factor FlgM
MKIKSTNNGTHVRRTEGAAKGKAKAKAPKAAATGGAAANVKVSKTAALIQSMQVEAASGPGVRDEVVAATRAELEATGTVDVDMDQVVDRLLAVL